MLITAAILGGCNDNAWNDMLDGFKEDNQASYGSPVNVSYSLTKADYDTISARLKNIAVTEEEIAAANAIKSNQYFDQTSPYPAQVAIPVLLNRTGTDFYVYNNGSTLDISFNQSDGVPEEVSKISSSPQYRLTSDDYQTVWGSETDYIDAFSPSHPASRYINTILKDSYDDAVAGDYVIVTYNSASENPVFGTIGGGGSDNKNPLTSNISNLAKGDYLTATAVVTAQSSSGLILTDNAGSILYYNYNTDLDLYPIGTVVKVEGEVGSYGNGLQLTNSAVLTVDGTMEFQYPKPTNYTASMIDAAVSGSSSTTVLATYVTIEGSLTISGNYYNVVIEGSNNKGSISYPSPAIKEKLEDGKSYKITGYYVYISGGSYFNVVATDVVELGAAPENPSTPVPDNTDITSNIKNLKAGDTLTATAIVTAQASTGLILTDNAGSILYYNTSVDLTKYPIGSIVNVSGNVVAYQNGLQLNNSATLNVSGTTEFSYPTPTFYTPAMIESAAGDLTSGSILATYVSMSGTLSMSPSNYGYYYNVIMDGTEKQGSLVSPSPAIAAKLTDGESYTFTGYYTYFTSSGKYFNVVVTDVAPATKSTRGHMAASTRDAAVSPATVTENAIYKFDGANWVEAEEATVLNPADYAAMGMPNNSLTDPQTYLPIYMKEAYPYAQPGAEMFVAYNLNGSSCATSVLLYDGGDWKVNNNYLEEVTAQFAKSSDVWAFRKYLGEEVYMPFTKDEIQLNASYLLVSGSYCATPVEPTSGYFAYSYPVDIEFNPEDQSVVLPNSGNSFTFLSEVEYNGQTIEAPEGKFVIRQSDGAYLYLGNPTYYNFGVRQNNPWINNDNTIDEAYLWSAEKQADGLWMIYCDYHYNGADAMTHKVIYYADSYTNFANYTDEQLATHPDAVMLQLYISMEDYENNSAGDNNDQED